jgi:hypothetical protein
MININIKKIMKEIFYTTLVFVLAISLYWVSLKNPILIEVSPYQLSQTTQTLLQNLDKPLHLTLYTQDVDTHHLVLMLVERYQKHHKDIHFSWQKYSHDPQLPHQGLVIEFEKSKQIIDLDKTPLDENKLTNALFKLYRKPNQWVVFLQGHGEPSIFSTKNNDLSLFRLGLENQGIKTQELNLSQTPVIPDNTNVLVIAAVKSPLMPGEEKLIADYLNKGKSILWLIDPDSAPITSLSARLGIIPLPGTIVDLQGQKLGTPHPAITIVNQYPKMPFSHPDTLTAFPFAVALDQKTNLEFQTKPLLLTHAESWNETSPLNNQISFNPEKNERAGPLLLGAEFTRKFPDEDEQRIVVIGNSRFIRNGAIENYGNLGFGLNLLNWLNHDDKLLHISQPVVKDALPNIHLTSALLIQYGFPMLSFILLISSLIAFWRIKHRSNKMASKIALT